MHNGMDEGARPKGCAVLQRRGDQEQRMWQLGCCCSNIGVAGSYLDWVEWGEKKLKGLTFVGIKNK
ncbi:hypothetical protein GYH30_038059 [Glycine max]|nr:hypothetical protein GYH30_038059 [Glycine max]